MAQPGRAGSARLWPLRQRRAQGSPTRRRRLLRRGVPAPGPPGRGEWGRKEGPPGWAGGPEGGARLQTDTRAPRGALPAPARTHSLAFTLAHRSLTPSGGCISPQRAPPSPPDSPWPPSPVPHLTPLAALPHPPANRWSPAHTLRQPLTFFQRTPRTLHRSHTPSHHSGALAGGTAPCGKTSDTDRRATLTAWSCSERGIPPSLVAFAGYIRQRIREIYGTLEYAGNPSDPLSCGVPTCPMP